MKDSKNKSGDWQVGSIIGEQLAKCLYWNRVVGSGSRQATLRTRVTSLTWLSRAEVWLVAWNVKHRLILMNLNVDRRSGP